MPLAAIEVKRDLWLPPGSQGPPTHKDGLPPGRLDVQRSSRVDVQNTCADPPAEKSAGIAGQFVLAAVKRGGTSLAAHASATKGGMP